MLSRATSFNNWARGTDTIGDMVVVVACAWAVTMSVDCVCPVVVETPGTEDAPGLTTGGDVEMVEVVARLAVDVVGVTDVGGAVVVTRADVAEVVGAAVDVGAAVVVVEVLVVNGAAVVDVVGASVVVVEVLVAVDVVVVGIGRGLESPYWNILTPNEQRLSPLSPRSTEPLGTYMIFA